MGIREFFNKLNPSSIFAKWKANSDPTEQKRMRAADAIARLQQFSANANPGLLIWLPIIAMATYFLADTVSLFTETLIPEPPVVPAPRIVKRSDEKRRTIEDYAAITSRNIFSSTGTIPEEEGGMADGPARKTTLPLNLIGTIVLKNELRSIATIEDKSQNMIFPVRIDDTIDDRIRITKIERFKVYFINKSTGHLEYVEISDDTLNINPQIFRATTPQLKRPGKDGVTQTSETSYELSRTTVDKAISNLGEVLQQARAIPNYENGIPDGYKMTQVQPGSIFEMLGIKDNDVVTHINGDPINDPAKALALFNDLKSSSHIEISVKRNGVRKTHTYDIGK